MQKFNLIHCDLSCIGDPKDDSFHICPFLQPVALVSLEKTLAIAPNSTILLTGMLTTNTVSLLIMLHTFSHVHEPWCPGLIWLCWDMSDLVGIRDLRDVCFAEISREIDLSPVTVAPKWTS